MCVYLYIHCVVFPYCVEDISGTCLLSAGFGDTYPSITPDSIQFVQLMKLAEV